jgi:hypothetical protein
MLNVACSTAENINLAFYQNAVPIVRELSVGNQSDTPVSGVEVHLSSEPGFVSPGVWRIDKIAPSDVHHLPTVDLKLNTAFLSGLTASRRGEIRVRVEVSGQLLAEKKIEVNLLPPTHWGAPYSSAWSVYSKASERRLLRSNLLPLGPIRCAWGSATSECVMGTRSKSETMRSHSSAIMRTSSALLEMLGAL